MSMRSSLLSSLTVVVLSLTAAGCEQDSPSGKASPVELSWSEVKQKFAENGVTAHAYFKAHPVRLSGEVKTISTSSRYAAIMKVSDETDEGYSVAVLPAELPKIRQLKSGQYLTMVCDSISHGEIAEDCLIEKVESEVPLKIRKNRSLRNPIDSGYR